MPPAVGLSKRTAKNIPEKPSKNFELIENSIFMAEEHPAENILNNYFLIGCLYNCDAAPKKEVAAMKSQEIS